MTYYIRQGNTYRVTDEASLDIAYKLPIGNYTVGFNQMTQSFYLEMVDSFTSVPKIYGDTTKRAERIMHTFKDRPNSTGIFLTGEKGSGKTLLGKVLSQRCAQDFGMPTLIINQPFCGDTFNKFIQDIDTESVIFFDEFEKVYNDRERQQQILTLLDGTYPSKKLFVLTCNDKWALDQHFHNRPGRLFYQFEYEGLEPEFIREYCMDVLKDKGQTDNVVKASTVFAKFNFDMLKAIVEDMNRFNEPVQEVLKFLNCKPSNDRHSIYDVVIMYKGNPINIASSNMDDGWRGVPLLAEIIPLNFDPDPNNPESEWIGVNLTQDNLIKLDADNGSFIYEKGDVRAIFKRQVAQGFEYSRYF